MKYHFLNSFNLGAGYEDADYVNGHIVKPNRRLPDELNMDYKNGGCLFVLRSCKDYCYLLIKKILYVNKQKTLVQQGRTVNINFSIEAALNELPQVCNICAGILTEWGNFCRRLGDVIQIPSADHNEYGYSIDKQQFEKLLSYMEERGRKAALPSKVGNALKKHSSEGILLVVPSENKQYYIDNFKAIDSSGKNFRLLLKSWDCVLSASRDTNNPMEFEKLTSLNFTEDYEAFLKNASVINGQEGLKVSINSNKTGKVIDKNEVITNEEPLLKRKHNEVVVQTISELTNNEEDDVEKLSIQNATRQEEFSVSYNTKSIVKIIIVGIIGFVLGYLVAKVL